MDEKIISFYADYKQGRTNRRDFVRKLAIVAGSTAAAMAMLPVLEYNNLKTSGATQDDPELMSEFIKYPGATGEIKAFLSHPKEGNKFPAIIVIHEIWGLDPHILNVTKRIAKEGFLVMAPDALSQLGGTPEIFRIIRTILIFHHSYQNLYSLYITLFANFQF